MIEISVIVPIYNVEDYLKEALNSLSNQTYKNFEVILVDDSSTDNSLKIAKHFLNDSRFKLFVNKINSGLSFTRNVGIEQSRGKYLYFFDSDDRLPNNLFEYLVKELASVDLVSFNSTFLANNVTEISSITYEQVFDREQAISLLLNHRLETAPWSFIFRKSLLGKDIRFPEGHNFEDISFTPKLLDRISKMKLVKFNPGGYFYRRGRTGSITNSLSYRKKKQELIDKEILNKQKLNFLIARYNKDYVYSWYIKELCMMYDQYYDSLISKDKILFNEISEEVRRLSKNSHIYTWNLKDKLLYLRVRSEMVMRLYKYYKKLF